MILYFQETFLDYLGKWYQCARRKGTAVVSQEKENTNEKPSPISKIGEKSQYGLLTRMNVVGTLVRS